MNTAMPDQPKFYTLSAKVTFTSGLVQNASAVLVLQEESIIVPSTSTNMYSAVDAAWST